MTLRWAEDEELVDEARAALTGAGAPFEMADLEVLGTTVRGFVRRPRSAPQMLLDAAGRFGDRPFLVFPDRCLTFASLAAGACSMAAALRDRFGIQSGERVAVVAANVPGQPLTAWATALLGAVVVELNGWWTGAEMAAAIELTQPSVILGDRPRLDRLDRSKVSCPVVCFEDDLAALEDGGRHSTPPAVDIDEDDPLVVLFTSGTTGRPKGATLSHRAHVHMMMQATLQGAKTAVLSGQPSRGPGLTVGVSPMFHISGFTTQLIGGTYTGGTYVYPPPGRWDERTHLALTEEHRATAWSLVPTQLWRLLEHPALGDFDTSSLTRIGGGGATFDPELWRQVQRRLGPGVRMVTGYGMSETCGAGTHHDGADARDHPDALGRPGPGMEIQVRDGSGRPAADGQLGEICLRGPTTMLGYWDDPGSTASAIDDDRWYRTGEVGHVTGGLVYLDGRGSELIVRGGENVYPVEIENRLMAHPAVAEAAVVGVSHRTLGEEVAAVVVVAPGSSLDADELRVWAGRGLARHKVPAHITFVAELPHSATGKVLKRHLPVPGPTGRPDRAAGSEPAARRRPRSPCP